MLTIQRIDTIPFRLPMHGALQWGAHSVLAELRHVLVRVELSDGSVGLAEAPPRPTIYGETVASICAIINDELAPRVTGIEINPQERATAEIWQRLNQIKNNHGAKGAVDIALHAALAQSGGTSLAKWLGVTQARVKVSYILGIGTLDAVLQEAARIHEHGVRVLKVKVGRNWAEDVALVENLRAEFGAEEAGGFALYADANECLDPADAAQQLDALRKLGLHYCEEPLPVEQLGARAALRAGEHLPLIADDSAFTVRDLERELTFDTFDILNIKTARTGYTGSSQMLNLAQRAGKDIMIGSQASAGLGTARAALFAALPGIDHPSELSFFLKLKEDIITQPIPIRDGYMQVADALNVQVDEARLRDYFIK